MKPSLRRLFLALLLSGISVWWGLVSLWVYHKADHEIEEVYDGNLVQTARAILSVTEYPEDDEEYQAHDFEIYRSVPVHPYETKLAFIVSTASGKILLQSPEAPIFSRSAPGFRYEQVGPQRWRVFTLTDTKLGLTVQTGERYAMRREMIWEIIEAVLNPLLFALPVLAVIIWFSVGHSLRPLAKITRDIAARDPNQLQAVDTGPVPVEVRPLLEALNKLLGRLDKAFANERRFTADAAHELRTPLAGIKVQAEVAQRAVHVHQQREALQHIQHGVERATHLVEQLLALARMDVQDKLPMRRVAVEAVCIEAISSVWPQAQAKNIDLALDAPQPCPVVHGNPDALYLLLRNLVDNAVRYTPADGQVLVRIQNRLGRVRLCVADSGPGVPATEREVLLERFRRGKHQQIGGSGLGLSIVQRIAELHGSPLDFADGLDGKGLSICVTLPEAEGFSA